MGHYMSLVTKRLTALLGSTTFERASYKVHASATYYPYFVRVFIPENPYSKLLPGMEPTKKVIRTKNGSIRYLEEDTVRSLRRTKKTITDYVLCNQFDLFATFTIGDDRHNVDRSRARMSDWLKNTQKRSGKFDYLIVPELHKDGALHFHGLFKDYSGKLSYSGRKNRRGQPIWNVKGYRSGFTTAVKIPPKDNLRVGLYVRKYITKDMPLFFGKNRYWASIGLKLPVVEDNPPDWYLKREPYRKFKGEFGTFLYFTPGTNDG